MAETQKDTHELQVSTAERDLIVSVRRLKFGEVTATVHEGDVVQIDETKKTRYARR